MKHILLIIIAAAVALAMGACAKSDKAAQQSQDAQQQQQQPKVLVAYFSASGVTQGVAKQIAEITGGDLYQIQPKEPYTAADLDWNNDQSRSSLEMKDKNSRPAIAGKVDHIEGYDVVYLGFPIWWYTAPTIINTFVEAHNLKGKTVIPFATSGGSTIEKACADLKAAYPDVNWQEGRLLNSPSRQDLEAWVKAQAK